MDKQCDWILGVEWWVQFRKIKVLKSNSWMERCYTSKIGIIGWVKGCECQNYWRK